MSDANQPAEAPQDREELLKSLEGALAYGRKIEATLRRYAAGTRDAIADDAGTLCSRIETRIESVKAEIEAANAPSDDQPQVAENTAQ